MMKYKIAFLLFYSLSDVFGQNASEIFEKSYTSFKNAHTMFIVGSFKGFGKNAGNVVEANGTIALEKNEWRISRYKSFAISEVAILEKINYEEVIFDGHNVYSYNPDKSVFENKGSWEPSGKNYSGYSKILYGNLLATYEEFNRNKDVIIQKVNDAGYVLTLPQSPDRGDIIMQFTTGSPIPTRIVRYNEKFNEVDFVVLTLTSSKLNSKFPSGLFNMKDSSLPKDTTSVSLSPNELLGQSGSSTLLSVGTRAPDWELINSDGIVRRLSDFRGKVVVLDFWATWCAPCIQAQSMLQRLQNEYKEVIVLGMNFNDKKGINLNDYKVKKGISYEMILNAEKIEKLYNVKVLPTAYVIDKSGYIVFSSLGYNEKEDRELILTIERTLK